jgi:hypothetical protein
LWVGLGGFILAAITGILATVILFASGLLSLLLRLVPPEQPLVHLLLGIILVFVGLGLGGATGGLVRGYTLHLIDSQGSHRRYLLGGAFSTGISQAILVVPIMLFISLVSIYNVGSQKDPASFIVLFALVGALFGLVNGAILSLVTVRLRYAWISWLGYLLASTVGGALFGLVLGDQIDLFHRRDLRPCFPGPGRCNNQRVCRWLARRSITVGPPAWR